MEETMNILPFELVKAFDEFCMLAHMASGHEPTLETVRICAEKFAPIYNVDVEDLFANYGLFLVVMSVVQDASSAAGPNPKDLEAALNVAVPNQVIEMIEVDVPLDTATVN